MKVCSVCAHLLRTSDHQSIGRNFIWLELLIRLSENLFREIENMKTMIKTRFMIFLVAAHMECADKIRGGCVSDDTD